MDDAAWRPPRDDAPRPTGPIEGPADPATPRLPPPPPVLSPWAPGGGAGTELSPTVPSDAMVPSAAGEGASTAAAPTPAAPVAPARAATRSRRSRWVAGSAVAALLAIGASGVFAVANLTRPASGGAADPADLGTEFLAAIDDEDVLGVIDVLLPGEREVLGDPFVEMVGHLQRLGVLAETDLSQLAGFDVQLSNQVVRTRSTNVDDIVDIAMSADVTVSVDGSALPIGSLLTEQLPEDALAELRGARVTQSDRLDLTLTAVLQDGRWYFSVFHTLAELARGELDGDRDIPVAGLGARGADTPEAVLDQLLAHVEALDLAGLIRSLDPAEAAALQRYAPLFLDGAQQALDEVPLRWRIVDRALRVEGSGDRRTAFVDALTIEGDIDGAPLSFTFLDSCVTVDLDGLHVEQCGQGAAALDDVFADQPEVTRLVEVVRSAFADLEPVGVELRRRDGGWFVSPVASVDAAVLAVFRALDRDELDAIIAAGVPAFSAVTAGIFGSLDDLAGGGDPFGLDSADPMFDDLVSGGPSGGGDPIADPAWYGCYDLDVDEAIACFRAAVEQGDLTADMVPVVLRSPECGYAEVAWGGDVFAMPDDQFVATVEAARPCLLALVEAGSAEWWELPDEIVNLECFEGRNWYQVFDDPAYDARVSECRMALVDRQSSGG